MESSKNDISRSVPAPEYPDKNDTHKDEIDLMDFFRIIYKRKGFILLCSVIPALLVGLVLLISPKDYKTTYTYDLGQDEIDYKMLLGEPGGEANLDVIAAKLKNDELSEKDRRILIERFYRTENLNKLAEKLRANGYDEYAQGIS